MPDQMTPAQRAAYRRIFTLSRGNQFAAAAAALNTMPSNGLLTGTGWAELWLAAGSPGASAGALSGWLSTNIALPQAERSEEHTSELQSLMRTSYAVFCLKKKNHITTAYYT